MNATIIKTMLTLVMISQAMNFIGKLAEKATEPQLIDRGQVIESVVERY